MHPTMSVAAMAAAERLREAGDAVTQMHTPLFMNLSIPDRLRDLAGEINRTRINDSPTRLRESDVALLQQAAKDLEVLVNAVDSWPDHPWIPGVLFRDVVWDNGRVIKNELGGPLYETVKRYRG